MLPNAEVPALPSRRVRSTSICKVNILIRPLIISLLTTSLHNPSLNGSDRQNISNLHPSDPVSGSPFVPSPLIPSLRAVNTGAIPLSPFQISCIHSLTLYRLCILPGLPLLAHAVVPFRQLWPAIVLATALSRQDLSSCRPFPTEGARFYRGNPYAWTESRSPFSCYLFPFLVPSPLWRCGPLRSLVMFYGIRASMPNLMPIPFIATPSCHSLLW